MMADDLGMTTQILEIRKRHPLVTEAVSTRLGEMLNAQLSERQLTPKELMTVAKALITDMAPAAPTTEAKQ